MKNRLFSFFVLLVLMLAGCDQAKEITKEALLAKTHIWREPKVAIWYYVGSKDGRDYFQHHDLGISEVFTVESGQITLPSTFPISTDQKKWVVMPWGPASLK